jgi:hypothetical protein
MLSNVKGLKGEKKTAGGRRLVQGFSALLRLNLSTAGAA